MDIFLVFEVYIQVVLLGHCMYYEHSDVPILACALQVGFGMMSGVEVGWKALSEPSIVELESDISEHRNHPRQWRVNQAA